MCLTPKASSRPAPVAAVATAPKEATALPTPEPNRIGRDRPAVNIASNDNENDALGLPQNADNIRRIVLGV